MTSNVDGGNRFAIVTPDDHSAWIWLAVLHSLCYSICFLGFRVIVKLHRYGLDDLLLALAYLFAVGHWASIFVSLTHQLGKSSDLTTEEQLLDASKSLFASRILLIPALALAKISVVVLIRQIFTLDTRLAWMSCNIFIGVLTGWAVMGMITLSAGCSPTATIGLAEGVCRNESLRWYLVFILDALTEIVPVILIYWFMKPLSMNWRLKMIVALAFSARILVAIVSLVFLHSTVRFLHKDRADWPLAITDPVIWQEALVGVSLIAATIPCLRPFMNSFQTGGLVYVTGLGKLADSTRSSATSE